MSRMTRFLKQECTLAFVQRELDGTPKLDQYGQPLYLTPSTIKCRREQKVEYVQTSTGALVMSTTFYYIDNTYVVRVGDKLDGLPIQAVADFINGKGGNEGYRCQV